MYLKSFLLTIKKEKGFFPLFPGRKGFFQGELTLDGFGVEIISCPFFSFEGDQEKEADVKEIADINQETEPGDGKEDKIHQGEKVFFIFQEKKQAASHHQAVEQGDKKF